MDTTQTRPETKKRDRFSYRGDFFFCNTVVFTFSTHLAFIDSPSLHGGDQFLLTSTSLRIVGDNLQKSFQRVARRNTTF